MDVQKRVVFRAGQKIELSKKEFRLLEYMMRNKEVALSREQLEQRVWNSSYEGGSNIVDVYIRYLRKKIDAGFKKKLIHTVHGVGYRIGEKV